MMIQDTLLKDGPDQESCNGGSCNDENANGLSSLPGCVSTDKPQRSCQALQWLALHPQTATDSSIPIGRFLPPNPLLPLSTPCPRFGYLPALVLFIESKSDG